MGNFELVRRDIYYVNMSREPRVLYMLTFIVISFIFFRREDQAKNEIWGKDRKIQM